MPCRALAAGQVTAADDGMLVNPRVLICDRDRKWTPSVRQLLATSGIRIVQAPFRAPNANAYAERFVRSIKDECLSRVIPFGERHRGRTIAAFIAHYHAERNHQGLGNDLIDAVFPRRGTGCVRRRERLDGVLNYYNRAA